MSERDLFHRVEAWIAADPDPLTRNELAHLLNKARQGGADSAAGVALAQRFAGPLAFGTAGLRGPIAAGESCMNRAVVIRATAGLMAWLHAQVDTPRVVVGCDGRHGSADFAAAAARVISAAGGEALVLPPAQPTPLTAYAVRALGADAGVMVTASHNPGSDNGYKVYTGGRITDPQGAGVQIIPPADREIAAAIAGIGAAKDVPMSEEGIREVDPRADYRRRAASLARPGAPVRLVLTPMHGVGGDLARATLAEAGFTDVHVVAEQADPDPDFPTVAFPNPEEDGALDLAKARASEVDADLIIALDPDADRCAVCVPEGEGWRQLSGDETGMLLADFVACAAGAGGEGGTLATSIVSTRGIGAIARHHGLDFHTTLTGFKWIARVRGLIFGCEEAIGYCPDPRAVADKDGIATAVLVASLAAQLADAGRTLSDALDDIARRVGAYRTRPLTFRVDDVAEISAGMARLREHPPTRLGGETVTETADLADGYGEVPPTDGMLFVTAEDSRVIVRPSGTEPKLKCYLEATAPAGDGEVDWAGLDRRLEALARDVAAATGLG